MGDLGSPRRGRFVRSLTASLALGVSIAASTAHAQSTPPSGGVHGKEHAKRLFEEGVDLEKKSDYAGALVKYREAEQITATPGLRFHKAYCLEMTGKLAAAVEEYESADKMARDANKADIKTAVQARLDPLRARVPQIAIHLTTVAKDAEVQLDGVVVGAPLLDGKAFRLDPGEHNVSARAPGFTPFTRRVQTPEGQTTSVDIALERLHTAAVVPEPVGGPAATTKDGATPLTEPPEEHARPRPVIVPIMATAGAVVLLGTGVAMFLVAGSAQSDAESACPGKLSCDSEQSRVRAFDALALGSFIGAAGLGVVSVLLWTSRGTDKSAARAPHTRIVASPSMTGLQGVFW